MLEFSILVSKRKLADTIINSHNIKNQYHNRSILTEMHDVKNHFFMNNHAVFLFKQKYLYQGNLVYQDEFRFTALVGYIVSPQFTNNPQSIVKELHYLLIKQKDRTWLEECLGEFIICHFNGMHLEVIPSQGATHLVYYRQSDEEILISNRLSLTNLSLTNFKPQINILSQLQIIAYDSIFNEETSFKDSFCLERGYHLKIGFNQNTPQLHKHINPHYLGGTSIYNPHEAIAMINDYTYWILDQLHLFSKQVELSSGMDFLLSGGKDSRLLLSLFVKSGLMSHFNQVVTFGSPGDAEALAASLVADHYDLKHEIIPRKIAKNIFFERLPYHVYHMEGEINARILSGNYTGLRKAEFTGHELGLREDFVKTELIHNEKDLFHYINHQLPLDPIGFMKTEVTERLKQEVKDIYYKSAKFNITTDNFLNYFIIMGRGPRWAGKITSMNSAVGPYINLLINSPLLTLTNRIGVNNRNLHLVHLGMLQALDKEILKIPFAKQDWPRETLKLFKRKLKLPKKGLEDDLKNKNYNQFANQWWDAIYYKDDGRFMKQILHELRHNELDQVIDYNIVNHYIDNAKKVSGRAMLSIYGILSSSLLLHAGDVTSEQIPLMQDIVSTVLNNVEKGYQPSINVKTKNVISLPIKNIIYKSFYEQYPMGSDRVRLMGIKLNNSVYEGIFVHSGNEVEITLPFNTIYSFDVRIFVLPQVKDKCSEQIFEIINSLKVIYTYHYPKEKEKVQNISFKGNKLKLRVHSPISSQYGWCMFVLDNIRFN